MVKDDSRLTVGVVARLELKVSAVLALLAVAVGDEDLLVRELQVTHDRDRVELGVQDYYHAGLAVLLVGQLLAAVLEGGAPRVLADLQTAVTFDDDLAGLLASLVVRAAKEKQSYLRCIPSGGGREISR